MLSDSIFYLSSIFLIFALLGYFFLKFFDNESTNKINPDYLTGLKYLLNEESDNAIDLFSNIIDIDDETIQTHLALGVLFRRQGKIDKAIRLHENILNKPDLHEEYYYQTLHELGENYFAAGIYDKAESVFNKLKTIDEQKVPCIEKLITIYEYMSQWEKALENLEELSKIDPDNKYLTSTSHYYCQLTQKYIDEDDIDRAEIFLEKAKHNNPNSIRQLYLSSKISLHKLDKSNALVFYAEMIDKNKLAHLILLPLILNKIDHQNDNDLNIILEKTIENNPETKKYLGMVSVMFPSFNNKHLFNSFKELIQKHTIINELKKQNHESKSITLIDDPLIDNLRTIINNKTKNDYKYSCSQCGYMTISHSWQCPTCKSWEKSEPVDFLEKI